MSGKHRCGVYAIEQVGTDRIYIGSSGNIENRWYQHRLALRRQKHHSPFLQRAWDKYGADAFRFVVLDECPETEILELEQEYLDVLLPVFNVCPVTGPYAIRAMSRARAAQITECPKGHPYDFRNTAFDRKGSRYCRACAAGRTNAIYASETPEQREVRRQRSKAYYEATHEERQAKMREYAATRKEEKRAYDQSRAELKAERDRTRRANETLEQRANRLTAKTVDYQKHHAQRLAAMHANYRKNHPEPQPATACKNGHAYTDDSFRMWRGKKLCKVCRAQTKRAYRERVKVSVA